MKLPVVSSAKMRRIEEQTFAAGVTAQTLMEEVGRQIADAVRQWPACPGSLLVYYGKGHNGGDALVAARHLAAEGWQVELRPQERDPSKLAELTRGMLQALESGKLSVRKIRRAATPRPPVILDGLLGISASGPLRDDIRALTREINNLRLQEYAHVVAVDLPTGLDADTGKADPDCVVADMTVTAGYAKTGLVADGAAAFVGRLCVAPLAQFKPHAPTEFTSETASPASLHGVLPRRNFDSYKTQYGRIGIVAGSPGFTGAAVLCANGALRGGAGLVTVYASEDIQPILAVTAPPEVMVHPVKSYSEVQEQKHDVLALGPGLGKGHAGAILHLIEHAECPMVLDADGLNLVAAHNPDLLLHCAGPRLLTPHPGEMGRLFPESSKLSRYEAATRFTARHANARFPITLLLKGSRTIIREQGKPASYNTTGNPGMGTGGMGDVLTGVCAALIGQHLSPYDAARTGAWLCGASADIGVQYRSEESLAAMDVVEFLGEAFGKLRSGSR
ncbi:MAG: NAD(P)H-hydrate dehydratase [Chthoniobacteraceae bacterium]|jgi:NAD(P)H-hydrate epimerase